jgi:hypothetical protein
MFRLSIAEFESFCADVEPQRRAMLVQLRFLALLRIAEFFGTASSICFILMRVFMLAAAPALFAALLAKALSRVADNFWNHAEEERRRRERALERAATAGPRESASRAPVNP